MTYSFSKLKWKTNSYRTHKVEQSTGQYLQTKQDQGLLYCDSSSFIIGRRQKIISNINLWLIPFDSSRLTSVPLHLWFLWNCNSVGKNRRNQKNLVIILWGEWYILRNEIVVSVDGRAGRDIGTPLGKIELKTLLRWSLTLVKQYFSSFLSQEDNIDWSI